jgi:hypothetical protein
VNPHPFDTAYTCRVESDVRRKLYYEAQIQVVWASSFFGARGPNPAC